MQQPDGDNTKNMVIAMVLTLAVLVGWSVFFDTSKDPQDAQKTEQVADGTKPALPANNQPTLGEAPSLPSGAVVVPTKTAQEVVASSARLQIETPSLSGSIRLKGGRLDDLTLTKYNEKVDLSGKNITLLSPDKTEQPYFADFGWLSSAPSIKVPDANTVWQAEGNAALTVERPVVLTWDNGQGLTFERVISVDEDYLFTLKDQVRNASAQDVSLYAYAMITRDEVKEVSSFFILFEGPIGYLGDKLIEHKYDDLNEGQKTHNVTGGWAGFTDKYWLTALIPPQDMPSKVTYRHVLNGSKHRYFTDYISPAFNLKAGGSIDFSNHFYAGAKVLALLDSYEEKLGIKHFDLAVDFGWFYFLTKPIFHVLTYTKDYLGNFGLAILLLTVVLKLLFFPLANKSYRSMARMKQLQPKMAKLKELHKDDKMAMNQALMALYKKDKVNPMAGCLPMIVQIPVFFALYKVLFVSIEMRQAPFYGWIKDLSAPDPTSLFNLFGLMPWDVPSFLQIGAWPLIMGATMFIQQRLNPAPADPMQEKMFMLMPLIFTVMLASFPAGLVIYWAWNNTLTIAQQWTIMRMEAKRTGAK
tara:strand:- start:528 stop:2279 length:1752 start_codon:yes stop_codon:yes gene_type:complete